MAQEQGSEAPPASNPPAAPTPAAQERPRSLLRRGRIVHHVSRKQATLGDCEVAFVARVTDSRDQVVELAVWTGGGEWQRIRDSEHGGSAGHWHWPDECAKEL